MRLYPSWGERRIAPLRTLAVAGSVVYLSWQAGWLLHTGRPAPTLLVAVDLPAPTTGISRSLLALGAGDLERSWFFHPLSVPLLLVFLYAIGRTLWQLARRERLDLGRFGTWALFSLLGVSWIVKFWTGPQTW